MLMSALLLKVRQCWPDETACTQPDSPASGVLTLNVQYEQLLCSSRFCSGLGHMPYPCQEDEGGGMALAAWHTLGPMFQHHGSSGGNDCM